jgi:predicted amidohydrolase YtcJ
MKSMGAAASFFAPHVWYWGDRHQDIFLGPERAARIDPLASALQRGIRFGLHNDSPVTPISPLLSISTAASRLTSSGRVLGAGQAIKLEQALRAMTLDSAYLAFEENLKGALTEGKLGDIVVLEADPLVMLPQEVKDIPISMTIVGGEVAYSAA